MNPAPISFFDALVQHIASVAVGSNALPRSLEVKEKHNWTLQEHFSADASMTDMNPALL